MALIEDYLYLYSYNFSARSGVYAIVNVANGKRYVGSAKDIMRRADQHFHQLQDKKHPNYKLQEAYDTYGGSVFSIVVLEHCEEDRLSSREGVWLRRMWKKVYNIRRSTARPDLSSLFRHHMINKTTFR